MGSSATMSSLLKLGLALVAALLVAVPVALAATPEQQEYADQVEPICKANSEANSRILKGVKTRSRRTNWFRRESASSRLPACWGKR